MNNFVILIPSYNDWDSLNVLIPKIHSVIKDLNKNLIILREKQFLHLQVDIKIKYNYIILLCF